MFSKILCPTDRSEHADKALALAIDLARKYDATLVLHHAMHRDRSYADLVRFAEVEGLAQHVKTEMKRLRSMDDRIDLIADPNLMDRGVSPRVLVEVGKYVLEAARDEAEAAGLEKIETRLGDGDPADSILRCIDDEGIDCVIMGSRGLSDLKGLLLGSVSHKVANRAACTCILVK